MVIQKIYLCTF